MYSILYYTAIQHVIFSQNVCALIHINIIKYKPILYTSAAAEHYYYIFIRSGILGGKTHHAEREKREEY